MSKEIYISSTPQETRLAIVEKDELTEIYYERENEYTLAGSIYNGKVTRVLPGMQSSFVDIGLERDAFLYITDFMEEQGETADFDSGAGSGEARGGGRRDRGRGKRDDEPGGETAVETEAAARPDEARRDRPERNGNRDRRREAPGREPRGDNGAVGSVPPGPPEPASSAEAGEPGEDEEVGSGAPGADGSRRWRGRRGRRRGRPAVEGNGATAASDAPLESDFDATAEGGTAEFLRAGAETSPPPVPAPAETRREGGERFGGRDRRRDGSRDDRPGRRGEGGRERREDQGSRYGQRAEGASEAGPSSPSAEPFILPGESLSKYRKGGEAEAVAGDASHGRQTSPALIVKPSTQLELSGPWDGGATLPGETLSRYRESSSSVRAEAPRKGQSVADAEGAVGRDRRRERDLRRGRASFGESSAGTARPSERAEAAQTDVAPLEDITVAAYDREETEPYLETEPSPEAVVYEAQTDLAPARTEDTASVVLEAVEEFHETVAHFEPEEDASASYRVDPAGPSEFRQSAPDADVLVDVRFDEDDPIALAGPGQQAEGEFTAVQPTGEMISEWPLTPEAEVAANEVAADTAPIAHETAVQSVVLDQAEAPTAPPRSSERDAEQGFDLEFSPGSNLGFNPGDGQLEEELLDDEDGDLPQLQAGFDDDDTEEETLESRADAGSEPAGEQATEQATELGTDLGSLIREMSIDEITSADPSEADDEFDLDDEELEEDELEADEEGFSEGELAEAPATGASDEEDADSDDFAEFAEEPAALSGAPATTEAPAREGERKERRDGGRGGRDRGRDRERGRDRRGAGGRPGGRMSRHQAQTSDLPAISDLLKPGQELLVQIAKEPMAKKGARITSHIALPGRFLVFMPTVQHVGVSRKIESDSERRRLKEILISERGEASGGFIVRTAASGASEEELRSDLRFLLNLWADIKQRSESSKSPALIYHDLNLVERILRDQVTDNFSAIWVDTETEYERVLRFLQRFQPSLIRRVKLYTKDTPLFEQFGISEEINKALRSKVWLKSGGSIVINQTEALVAIDINTGKYVGKTARLEDTIVKTNLDAIPEIVRQIRLRDLGGIIVIDFIDMDERRNRTKVLTALEEELKKDRAPSKVLQFNDFGLVAITRKRVKQSLERTLSQTCNTCAGTGMVKSPTTVCNEIFVEFRKMHKHLDKGDVMLRVNPEVVKQLKAGGGKWLQEIEEVAGRTILVKSDPSLHPEQFDIQ